jgi:hypothetical protein
MTWRGGNKSNYDADQDGYWSDNTLIFDQGAIEIPKIDFDVLRKYLSVL